MPTQEDTRLRHRLKAVLARFPNLSAIVPPTFLGGNKVTTDRLRSYSDTRALRYWHNVNLPLVLHATESDDVRVRELMLSVLKTFDDFADRFRQVEGCLGTLKPLWEQVWSPDPIFWSVAACVYLALAWDIRQFPVTRFEEPTGLGNADADLTVQLTGAKTLVDLELEHLTTLVGHTSDDVKARLRRRADEKAGRKFLSPIPVDTCGLIAEVCVVAGEDVEWRADPDLPVEDIVGRPGARWMALRLVGVRHPDGLRFAIMPL